MEILLYAICVILVVWWIIQLIRGKKTIEDTKSLLRYFVCSLFWFAVAKLLRWLFGATFVNVLIGIMIIAFLSLLAYSLYDWYRNDYRYRHRRR